MLVRDKGEFSSYQQLFPYLIETQKQNPHLEHLVLSYQLLYRQWDEIDLKLDFEALANCPVYAPTEHGVNIVWDKVRWTLGELIQFQQSFFSYYLRSKGKKVDSLERLMSQGNDGTRYTHIFHHDWDGQSLIQTFFLGVQPILNITHYAFQKKAVNSLEKARFHFIFDEVGTGKTVSALYCLQKTLQEKQKPKILILCPYNKKNEWKVDIKRQLGLEAHQASGDKRNYPGDYKVSCFKDQSQAPYIFIKPSVKNDVLDPAFYTWSKTEVWDLLIIDEGHLCFENYHHYSSEKAILLTATPTVAYNEGQTVGTRKFEDYLSLMEHITKWKPEETFTDLFSPSDLFSQHFREDFALEKGVSVGSAQRNIVFLEPVERWRYRRDYLRRLEEVKKFLTYITYEQDDWYLVDSLLPEGIKSSYTAEFRDGLENHGIIVPRELTIKKGDTLPPGADPDYCVANGKLERLISCLTEDELYCDKSYIIFFNHKFPAIQAFEAMQKQLEAREDTLGTETMVVVQFGQEFEEHDFFGGETLKKRQKHDNQDMFSYMQRMIAHGTRVLFFTTGQTGGTGVNLGKFHGVVHYELPFTSVELEQRFGRVDRMDEESTTKDIIFILNQDSNPMLTYSTTKAHEICRYMPTRNTILFYPDFNRKKWEDLRRLWQQQFALFSTEEMGIFEEYMGLVADILIKNPESQEEVEQMEQGILNNPYAVENEEGIVDRPFTEPLWEYLMEEGRLKKVCAIYQAFGQFIRLKQELLLECKLFSGNEEGGEQNSLCQLSTELFNLLEEKEKEYSLGLLYEEEKVSYVEVSTMASAVPHLFRTELEQWKEICQNIVGTFAQFPHLDFGVIKSSGLFYRDAMGHYHRETVEEYRDTMLKM